MISLWLVMSIMASNTPSTTYWAQGCLKAHPGWGAGIWDMKRCTALLAYNGVTGVPPQIIDSCNAGQLKSLINLIIDSFEVLCVVPLHFCILAEITVKETKELLCISS